MSYDLAGQYRQFDAVAGMTDYSDPTWRSRIDIVLGNAVVASVEVQVGDPGQPLDVDVTGAFTMKIIMTTLSGNAGCGSSVPIGPALGDPTLTS